MSLFRLAPLACLLPVLAVQAAPPALDRVVVTATRTPQTERTSLAAVTVIDRARIERLQPASLADLLRGEAGIDLANAGGPGKVTTLFLRGTESDHVLVLVDGLRIGAATAGLAALQDIPPEQVERIEIVRGPFSSLYGADAIGGVVHVFTRQPQAGTRPEAFVGAGSLGARRSGAGLQGRGERGWFALHAAHESTEGIDAYRGNPAWALFETPEPDRDGYRSTSLSARVGTRSGDAWTLEAHGLRVEGHNRYDGGYVNSSDVVQQVVGARVRYVPSAAWAFTLNTGRTQDATDSFLGRRYVNTYDTTRDIATLQADGRLAGGQLSLGFDAWRDDIDSSEAFAVTARTTRGAFAQWQRDIGVHAVRLSARHDDDSQFGGRGTGAVSWGWQFHPGVRLVANAGTAFKAPSFNELYFPFYGNRRLQPETSRSVEMGLRGDGGALRWGVHAFRTSVDDLIVHDARLPPFGGPNNIDRARIRGIEASADTQWRSWTLRGAATWLDPRNASGGSVDGNLLPRRARLGGRLDLDRAFGDVDVGVSVTGAGARFDDIANRTRLGGYALTDLRLGYALGEDWSLRLTATNVFDRRYETAAYYNQPGRGWFLGLRYRPSR